MSQQPSDHRYIAALWEHPRLCIALFGVQFLSPEGARMYEEAGIPGQIDGALKEATAHGLLLVRSFQEGMGGTLLQYWRSGEDLDRWSRTMPHTAWWRWLIDNRNRGIGFYHEIYQVSAAEAIYEAGTPSLGPAGFCSTMTIVGGEGRSQQRQQRFRDAQEASITGG